MDDGAMTYSQNETPQSGGPSVTSGTEAMGRGDEARTLSGRPAPSAPVDAFTQMQVKKRKGRRCLYGEKIELGGRRPVVKPRYG
ncbi:MAG: hypothetical protein AAFN74_25445, partial [Myxococcota bacterium]